MKTLSIVVDFDEFKQLATSLSTGLEAGVLNKLGFECAEEAFDQGIVEAVSLSAHANLNPMRREQCPIIMAGILTAPVRVVQQLALDLAPAYLI